jgi:hypothetical protein
VGRARRPCCWRRTMPGHPGRRWKISVMRPPSRNLEPPIPIRWRFRSQRRTRRWWRERAIGSSPKGSTIQPRTSTRSTPGIQHHRRQFAGGFRIQWVVSSDGDGECRIPSDRERAGAGGAVDDRGWRADAVAAAKSHSAISLIASFFLRGERLLHLHLLGLIVIWRDAACEAGEQRLGFHQLIAGRLA